MPTRPKPSLAEQAEAVARLRTLIRPGTRLYTILRKVGRNGTVRYVSVVVAVASFQLNPDPGGDAAGYIPPTADPASISPAVEDITWLVARALGRRRDEDNGGIRIGGAGLDVGTALIQELAHVMWPNGFGCIGANCPASDHVNGDRDYTPHNPKTFGPLRSDGAHWHNDGASALRKEWL